MRACKASNPPSPLLCARCGAFSVGFIDDGDAIRSIITGLGWSSRSLACHSLGLVRFGLAAIYVALLKLAAGYPELELDDPNQPILFAAANQGAHRVGWFAVHLTGSCAGLVFDGGAPDRGFVGFLATVFMGSYSFTQGPNYLHFSARGAGGAGRAPGGGGGRGGGGAAGRSSKMGADLREAPWICGLIWLQVPATLIASYCHGHGGYHRWCWCRRPVVGLVRGSSEILAMGNLC